MSRHRLWFAGPTIVAPGGNVEGRPGTGHNRSALKACEELLPCTAPQESDLPLEEIRDRPSHERQITVAVSPVWRFQDHPEITQKFCTPQKRIALTSRPYGQCASPGNRNCRDDALHVLTARM